MRTWLNRVFWVLATAYAALVVWATFVLPDRVPTHWSGSGEPDQWASHTQAVIILALLGVVMVSIFGALIIVLPRSRSLTWVNVPNKAYWQRPENLRRAVDMVQTDVAVIGALTMAMVCAVPISIAQAGESPDASLPDWTMPVVIGYLVLVAGYLVWMVAVRWRVPRSGG